MLYENIVKLCKERKVSIAKLEQSCGLGNGTVSGWQSGQPRLDRVKLVADFFGVTIDSLLQDAEQDETESERC